LLLVHPFFLCSALERRIETVSQQLTEEESKAKSLARRSQQLQRSLSEEVESEVELKKKNRQLERELRKTKERFERFVMELHGRA
jgi:hypothetical protein